MAALLTLTQFAFKLGTHHRLTVEASAPFRKAYAAATPSRREAMRQKWRVHYVMGRLGVGRDKAEHILEMTRAQRTAHNLRWELAVNGASHHFAHHVMEREADDARDTVEDVVSSLRTRDVKDLADFFVDRQMTREQIKAAVQQALKLLDFK